MSTKSWSTTTKIVVSASLGLLAVLLLYAFRVMIQPTIIALLLTFVLYQPVSWVQQRTGLEPGYLDRCRLSAGD